PACIYHISRRCRYGLSLRNAYPRRMLHSKKAINPLSSATCLATIHAQAGRVAQGRTAARALSRPGARVLSCARQIPGGVMAGPNVSAADLGIMAGFPPPADKRITLE